MIGGIGVALGLVLVIEGLLYALVPGQLKRVMTAVLAMTDDQLRVAGVAAVTLGVAVVWLARAAAV